MVRSTPAPSDVNNRGGGGRAKGRRGDLREENSLKGKECNVKHRRGATLMRSGDLTNNRHLFLTRSHRLAGVTWRKQKRFPEEEEELDRVRAFTFQRHRVSRQESIGHEVRVVCLTGGALGGRARHGVDGVIISLIRTRP